MVVRSGSSNSTYIHVTTHCKLNLEIFSKILLVFPTLTGVKSPQGFKPIKVVIYTSIFHCKEVPFVVETYYTSFPIFTGVKILCKFTAIKVGIYSLFF
jgi:hypothetical protein